MKMILKCPFDQKDIAKSHGARWDPNQKTWYFEGAVFPEGLRQFADADELQLYDATVTSSANSTPADGLDEIPW